MVDPSAAAIWYPPPEMSTRVGESNGTVMEYVLLAVELLINLAGINAPDTAMTPILGGGNEVDVPGTALLLAINC
jgi:hypothetical protein